MVHALASLIGALLWLTEPVLSGEVHQSPAELMRNSGESIQLNCSHSIPNYDTILWYHQAAGNSGLTLMGYVNYENPTTEPLYKDHCSVSGDGKVAASLQIPKVRPADSGNYFCAASYAQ
ncbi:hypothetical protein GJAV_G00003690 [Gymnothorax javanicus]|nr:hypothetical protein GJAV_G00003690 [Gymnothorax javanicus]